MLYIFYSKYQEEEEEDYGFSEIILLLIHQGRKPFTNFDKARRLLNEKDSLTDGICMITI